MNISETGLTLLKYYEGLRLQAYDDANPNQPLVMNDQLQGTLTIGYGHTGKDVELGQIITEEYADLLLSQDIIWAERAVNEAILASYKPNASQAQFDAMVCLTFNIGATAFAGSSVLKYHNLGNFEQAMNRFKLWHKTRSHGVLIPLKGLIKRRFSEAYLYETGLINTHPIGWLNYALQAGAK